MDTALLLHLTLAPLIGHKIQYLDLRKGPSDVPELVGELVSYWLMSMPKGVMDISLEIKTGKNEVSRKGVYAGDFETLSSNGKTLYLSFRNGDAFQINLD